MKQVFNTLDTKHKAFFILDIWLIFTISIVWYILVSNNIKPTLLSDNECFWFSHFGYYCPGCGGTRAFESLLYGHFIQSIIYHPFVMYTIAIIVISFISYIVYFITRGNIFFFKMDLRYVIYADFIFIFYWLFKNLLIFYFNIYLF